MQLQPVEFNFNVLSNIREGCIHKLNSPDISNLDLPLGFIQKSNVTPDWNLTGGEMSYLETIKISTEQSVKLALKRKLSGKVIILNRWN